MKKYYWLKLKNDFFDSDDIKLVEAMPNGKDYILFYMKLLLKSINTKGRLLYKDIIPYTPEMLSTITNTNIDVVKSAIKLFSDLQLIDMFDNGELYMIETENMIGSEGDSAERVRKYRERKNNKVLQSNNDVTKSNTEKEKEKEEDLDKEKNNNTQKDLIFSNYKEIYLLFTQPKRKIKIPNKQSKTFLAYEKTIDLLSFDEMKNCIDGYLKYLSLTDWRIKKGFTAFMNSQEMLFEDWQGLIDDANKKQKNGYKPQSATDLKKYLVEHVKSVKNEIYVDEYKLVLNNFALKPKFWSLEFAFEYSDYENIVEMSKNKLKAIEVLNYYSKLPATYKLDKKSFIQSILNYINKKK